VFNFHNGKSFPDYLIGCNTPGKYKIVLDSDWAEFGGFNRVDRSTEFLTLPHGHNGRQNSFMVYIPNRTAIVLALAD